MRARVASEFNACLLIVSFAAIASMIAFINSSFRFGELANCYLVFAAAWLRKRCDSSILYRTPSNHTILSPSVTPPRTGR